MLEKEDLNKKIEIQQENIFNLEKKILENSMIEDENRSLKVIHVFFI